MAHTELLVRKKFTKADHLRSLEADPRRHGKPHGSYVIDLADLRKTVLLCPACNCRFDWKRHRFRKEKEFPYVNAKCDACLVQDAYCSMYMAEEVYTQARSTAQDRREERRKWLLNQAKGHN